MRGNDGHIGPTASSARHGEWLELRPIGGNADPEIVGEAEMPNKSNYFRGNDPSKWHSNVPNFGKVRYKEVYPGIDLVFYGNQGQMEFDFVVAPGADPNVIRMAVSADAELKLADNGDLRMKVGDSEIVFHAPVVYQAGPQVSFPLTGRPLRKCLFMAQEVCFGVLREYFPAAF
jgi:hypothetical protein